MSVLNTSRFRVNRGRVMGVDMAHVGTRFMTLTGAASPNNVQYFDIGSGAGDSVSPGAADYPGSGEENGLILQNLSLVSGAGATTTHVMIGGRLRDGAWKMYTWDNSATTATDVTTVAQSDAATVDLATVTVNDGFVIAASGTFDTIVANINQATVGGATVEEFSYWNGSSWAAVSIRDSKYPAAAPGHFDTTGWNHIRFEPPGDWAKTTGATGEGGVASGMYALRYRTTTACTTKPTSNKIRVGSTLRFCVLNVEAGNEVLADNMNAPITSGFESPWVWTETALGAGLTLTIAYTAEKTGFAGSLGV